MRKVINNILQLMIRPAVALSFIIYHLSFSPAGAQGLPVIRNYTAAEYGGHNRSYDVEEGADGTIFVANFEGLLYYDRARWRMIHTPDISRVTVCVRDSKNTMWVGGYRYFARVQTRANGELYLQQVAKDGLFDGEVMEIFEDDGSLQFVASDNNIYEVTETDSPHPTVKLKKHTNANFSIGVESNVVSLEALKEGKEHALMNDIVQTEKLDGGLQAKVKENV
jgi:ligand-binding sensor domain-containing protein